MSRSLTIVAILIVCAWACALEIGKSLAQTTFISRPSGGSAQNVLAESASVVHVVEAGDEVSSEVARLRQVDRAHGETTQSLIAKYKGFSDLRDREELRAQLMKVISEHFETRQQMRARELEELEAQIRHLRALHDRRQKEKDQIIGDRLQRLLRDADGLGWGSDDAATSNQVVPSSVRRSVSTSRNDPTNGTSRSIPRDLEAS
jgi:hypothetical protein